jgi:hypothetical protein
MTNTINLTASDSRTMSSSRFTAHKNQQKMLGKKNPRSRKTKITHQSSQLRLSLIINLLALRIKLNPISVMMVCVFVFSSICYLYRITFIYIYI